MNAEVYKLMLRSKIQNCNIYKDKIYEILLLLKNNEVDDSKCHKHNPFAVDNIESCEFKQDKVFIKYKGNINSTVLFDYNEKYRGFSVTNDKTCHVELIKRELNCQIAQIDVCIHNCNYFLEKTGELSLQECKQFFESVYDINDIILDQKYKNKSTVGYYLSICPIFGFVLDGNKMYIANSYLLKYENKILNLFCSYKKGHSFKRLLHRPNLKDLIIKFNEKPQKITSKNFITIVKNMAPWGTDCSMNNGIERIEYKLESIDTPLKITTTKL
jgi:hypothetical protein